MLTKLVENPKEALVAREGCEQKERERENIGQMILFFWSFHASTTKLMDYLCMTTKSMLTCPGMGR